VRGLILYAFRGGRPRNTPIFPQFARIHPAAAAVRRTARVLEGGQNVAMDTEESAVNLGRLAWLVTVVACLIAVLILVLDGYYGYAGVTLAVAISAAINLL
jgi:hypothetical protein